MGWTTDLVLDALEIGTHHEWITKEQTTREVIEGFLSRYGRDFYRIPTSSSRSVDSESPKTQIRLERQGQTIPRSITSSDGKMDVCAISQRREDLVVMLNRSSGLGYHHERLPSARIHSRNPFHERYHLG